MKQTVAQLKAEAKALKIPRYSKMRKAELIEAIAAHKEYDPADNAEKCYSVAIASLRGKLASFRREVIGECTLWLGDCREILPLLPKVDAVVTDPPYGIGDIWQGGYGRGWGRARAASELRNRWDDAPPHDVVEQLSSYPQAIIWGGNYFDLPPSRCWLVWNKPERNFSLAEAELAWTNIDAVVRVFDCPRSDLGRVHPTQKPLALMAWCVAKTKGTVLDPFMGSGTTGVACAKAGRKFVGVEREPSYFEVALRRIEEAYKQPDFFVPRPSPPVQLGMLEAAE